MTIIGWLAYNHSFDPKSSNSDGIKMLVSGAFGFTSMQKSSNGVGINLTSTFLVSINLL